MSELSDPIMGRIEDLQASLAGNVVLRWGTVTQESPLRVRLDGDTDPMAMRPDTLVAGLVPGDRVRVALQNRRATILGVGGGRPPVHVAFMAHLASNHARSGADAWAKVPFTDLSMNIGDGFNTSTDRFEAPVDGLYEFISQFAFTTTTDGPALQYFKNGVATMSLSTGNTLGYNNPYDVTPMVEMIELNAGDYVEVHMRNANAVAITMAASYGTRFTGKLLYTY